jgi:serine/threonine protein kinase
VSTELERRALAIFETALSREGNERERYVAEGCGEDEPLRRQVESLLEAHAKKGSFLGSSPVESETATGEELVPGRRFGAYSIVRALGRGGMGEVYLAQDSRLGRKVALKLLRSEYTRDPERMKRFEREARAASALNHPNLLTVHEIGEEGSRRFMASEYVEGESLRQILSKRRMSVEEAVEVGVQVASGLAAAHEAGVVHRDVKPDNVMVRPDGFVKVLDLGLAKLLEKRSGELEAFASGHTETGMVMGTLKYMSPEQARGQAVDERTDIFSLGVMLYEMVAGRAPFEGTSSSDVLVAILEKEPPPLSGSGFALEEIVSRALEKDPSKRYSTMKGMLSDLREVKRGLDAGTRPRRRARFDLRKAGGVAAALAVAAVAAWYFGTRSSDPGGLEASFSKLTSQPGRELHPSLSPDGKWFLYVSDASGNSDIYLQAVGGQNPINLTKDSPARDTTPEFSPDGERIAFRSEREGGGILVMGRTGESPRIVAEKGFSPAWSPDGKQIAYSTRPFLSWDQAPAPGGAIWAVEVSSGEKRQLFAEDGAQPQWSPHGHRVAFVTARGQFSQDIQTVAADGAGGAVPVTTGTPIDWNPTWSADGGHIYFVSDRGGSMNLWRVGIEEDSGKVLGEPEPLTAPSTEVDHLTASLDGKRIAYVSRDQRTNIQRVAFDPERVKAEGEPSWITSGSNQLFAYDVSPDDEWVVYKSMNSKHRGLIIQRIDGTGKRDIGDFPMTNPSWSRAGNWIAFNRASMQEGGDSPDIYRIRPDGTGLERLTDSQRDGISGYLHTITSPDGSRMVMHSAFGKEGNTFLLDADVGLARAPEPLPPMTVGGDYFDTFSWSRDGEWLAGQAILLKGSHPGIVLYAVKHRTYERLTDFGGGATAWLPDGRRLLFGSQGKIHLLDRVTKETRMVFSVPPPEEVGTARLSRDGRQLFFLRSIDEADVWMAELK